MLNSRIDTFRRLFAVFYVILSFVLVGCNDEPAPIGVTPGLSRAQSPATSPTPAVFPSPGEIPPVLPLPSASPPVLPTPTPGQPPANPDFFHCWTEDDGVSIQFYRLMTPLGLRTFVTTENGQYQVFTKPFCAPTPDLFAAAVSYVDPSWLHVKFPLEQNGGGLQGTAHVCMGDFCPGFVKIYCEDRMREYFNQICSAEDEPKLTRKQRRQKRRQARRQAAIDWNERH